MQACFGEGELVVLSLEAVPGRRSQPGVARALVVSCDVSSITLSLQRRLRASLANPPTQVPRTRSKHCTLLRFSCVVLSSWHAGSQPSSL